MFRATNEKHGATMHLAGSRGTRMLMVHCCVLDTSCSRNLRSLHRRTCGDATSPAAQGLVLRHQK